MPPRRPVLWVDRPALSTRLASEHAAVALVGPVGSGRSSLLAMWSDIQSDVVWMDADAVPEVDRGTIIVDDAERLSPQVWAELGRRLAAYPDLRVRLAATSARVVPGAWDAEFVTDLFFTLEEIAAYLELAGSPLEPRLVAAATGGHPGSVRELGRPGVQGPSHFDATLARAGSASSLAPRDELLAVPDHLTEEVVAHIGRAHSFLEDAELAGIGAWVTDTGTSVFVLIPTVRESARAAMTISAERRRSIRLTAAKVFLREDAAMAAFVEAVRADDLDLAVTALRAGGMSLIVEHGYVVGGLLRPISVTRLRKYPVLALALALILNARRQNRLRAIELFGVAIVGARLGAGRPVDRALTRVVESAAVRVIGAGDGGVGAARRATGMLRSLDPEELDSLGRLAPHLHVHAGISLFYGDCFDEAREQFELALAAAPEIGAELTAVGGLALVDAVDGESAGAAHWLELAAQRVWPQDRLDEYPGSLLRMAQAQVAIDSLDFEAARAALDTIWPIVDTIEHWPLMAHLRAIIDIGTGQAMAGLEQFRSLRRSRAGRFGPPAPVQRLLAITESLLLLAVGQPIAAREAIGDPKQDASAVLAALRVALVMEDTEQALALLVRVVPRAPRERVALLSIEAVLLHQLGRSDNSREVAEKAAALAAVHGLRSPFMLLPPGHLQLFGVIGTEGVPEGLMLGGRSMPALTPRERVVLLQLAQTSNVESIAAALHVSNNTIKSQLRSVYRKLGVHSREDALAEALLHGLLSE